MIIGYQTECVAQIQHVRFVLVWIQRLGEKKRREGKGEKKESGQGVNKVDGQFKGWGFPFPDENSQHLIIMLGRSPVHLDIDIRQDI